MATTFTRPTLAELLTRVSGDIASRTEGRAFIRRTVERALGFSMAGLAHGLHGHLFWLRLELFPQTASEEALAEWGDWLGEPRKAGGYAAGSVTFTGSGSVPVGTLAADDAGNLYKIGSPVSAGVYAVQSVDTGVVKNLAAGERLSLVSPVAGIAPNGVVSVALSGGADIEDLELWRARVLAALRAVLLYGAPGDYERWALKREGVTDAWEHDRRMGAGTVSLAFMFGARDDVIPTPDDVAAMQTYIDSVRPADMAAVYVVAPERLALHFRVTARGTMTQAAMADALKGFFKTDVAIEQPLSLSQIDEVLSAVPGEVSHTITGVDLVRNGVTTPVSTSGTIAASSWGLFTFGSLTLTVAV